MICSQYIRYSIRKLANRTYRLKFHLHTHWNIHLPGLIICPQYITYGIHKLANPS